MRVYALASSHVPDETLDLFLTQEAAEAELREILEDEPEWVNVLRVVPIELDGTKLVSELRRGSTVLLECREERRREEVGP
jgi:hypothetical protein